ncbi:MAG: hypothetical protein GY711_24280 [bacterium]|nr:hypothetical protein [bacterium]
MRTRLQDLPAGSRSGRSRSALLFRVLGALACAVGAAVVTERASGIPYVIGAGTSAVALIVFLGLLVALVRRSRRVPKLARGIALACGAFFLALAALETVMWACEVRASFDVASAVHAATRRADAPADDLARALPEEIEAKVTRMQRQWFLPLAWNERKVSGEPRMRKSYDWHGVLHLRDALGMRRPIDTPFPPRDPSRFRIMVVGDSLTYGIGVDQDWTYSAQLQRALEDDYHVEVLNLGIPGNQSEETAEIVEQFLPQLEPDVVVYGVCLNDFLPKGVDRLSYYVFPLPKKIKRSATRRTRVGPFLSHGYQKALHKTGLWPSFRETLIGAGFDTRQARFGRDVAAMNGLVVGAGLPAPLGIVLDQRPQLDGPGRVLADAAEDELAAAGFEVIPSRGYYERFDGTTFRVSLWEGHPNERLHAIIARQLELALTGREDLTHFRKRDDR